MDWKRFKTIIIFVLVIINIFFSAYFLHMKISDDKVSRKTKENVISVLAKNNIILDDDDFPKGRGEYSACYASRLIESDTEFINKIKGEDGEMTVSDELFTFTFSPDKKYEITDETVVKMCRDFMTERGIYSDLYKSGKVNNGKEYTKVRFTLSYDDCKFFDSYIDFKLNEKGIFEIEGRNIIKEEETLSDYKEELMPAESVIVAIPKDKNIREKTEITGINFGYYLGKSAGVYISALALPVWRVEFDDKTFLYYDARNGNLITI